jgi:hypothetical protein
VAIFEKKLVHTYIKELFVNNFRSAPPPSTLTLNGLCRCVQAVSFGESDHLTPAESVRCGGGWWRALLKSLSNSCLILHT